MTDKERKIEIIKKHYINVGIKVDKVTREEAEQEWKEFHKNEMFEYIYDLISLSMEEWAGIISKRIDNEKI